MRVAFFAIVTAFCLLGCSARDPIDRLMAELSREAVVPSYPFKPIDLPETATPDQLISALSERSAHELGHFDFTSYKVLQVTVRRCQTWLASEIYCGCIISYESWAKN